jgi:hypothetical protein
MVWANDVKEKIVNNETSRMRCLRGSDKFMKPGYYRVKFLLNQ